MCESVPTSVSGNAERLARLVLAADDDLGEVLEVDLVDDAGAGRHDAQAGERALRPAQQLVALAVALVLALDVERERAGAAELVDLDRVVDDQVGRHERLDACRVAADIGHRVAHRGEIDDGRDAGEVLEQDARGHERDLSLDRRPWVASEARVVHSFSRTTPRRRCAACSRAGS